MRKCTAVLFLLSLLLLPCPVLAQQARPDSADATGRASFGGPDQVDAQLESDSQPKESWLEFGFLQSYFDFKDRLATSSGFSFGMDYSAVYFSATESLGEDHSAGGMFRFFSSWDLVNRGGTNTGAVIFKFSHRHSYTDAVPKWFGLNELAYVGMMAPPFNDDGLRLTNLYWRQRIAGGRFAFIGGFLDATDYVDVYALASPWLHFMNLAFSTGSSSINLPPDAGLGLAAAGYLTDQIYAIAGFSDSNADPTDPFKGFETLFEKGELFKTVEFGWTTSKDRFYFDNVHLTYWHKDEQEAGDPKGWGVNFSATTFLNDKWMPFLRGGYAEDGGSLLQRSVSAGVGYQPVPGRDLIGFAANWGQPNETTFASGLPDQYTFELFYRFQLSTRVALTPDIQYLIDPALDPDSSSIWIFGIRGRLAL
jgi:porin